MAQARCTLRVQGFDCPGEIPAIRAAVEGTRGASGLAFTPTDGTVTVDFDATKAHPPALADRVTRSAGRRAEVVAETSAPVVPSRSFCGWLPTGGSGVAAALG